MNLKKEPYGNLFIYNTKFNTEEKNRCAGYKERKSVKLNAYQEEQ